MGGQVAAPVASPTREFLFFCFTPGAHHCCCLTFVHHFHSTSYFRASTNDEILFCIAAAHPDPYKSFPEMLKLLGTIQHISLHVLMTYGSNSILRFMETSPHI